MTFFSLCLLSHICFSTRAMQHTRNTSSPCSTVTPTTKAVETHGVQGIIEACLNNPPQSRGPWEGCPPQEWGNWSRSSWNKKHKISTRNSRNCCCLRSKEGLEQAYPPQPRHEKNMFKTILCFWKNMLERKTNNFGVGSSLLRWRTQGAWGHEKGTPNHLLDETSQKIIKSPLVTPPRSSLHRKLKRKRHPKLGKGLSISAF